MSTLAAFADVVAQSEADLDAYAKGYRRLIDAAMGDQVSEACERFMSTMDGETTGLAIEESEETQ